MAAKFPFCGVAIIVSALFALYSPRTFASVPFELSLSDVQACKAQEDDKERLSCFDRMFLSLAPTQPDRVAIFSRDKVPTSLEAQAFNKDVLGGTSESNVDNQFGAERLKRKKMANKEQSPDVNAVAVKITRNRFGKYTVTLDNGQVWRQIQGDTTRLFISEEEPVIRIRRGSFGSYTLKVPSSKRPIRVKRVK